MRDCGGCKGIGSHKRHCHKNPTYTLMRELAGRCESLADSIGPNEYGAANLVYRAAQRLMAEHQAIIAARRQSDG